MALKVIDQWDESVASRIKENAETAKTVLDFLSGKMTYWSTAADIIEMMTEYVGEIPEYVTFNEAVEEYSQATAELNASNVDIPITPDMTVAEVDNAHMEQQRAQLIASRKEREAYAKVSTAATAYVKALNKDARIQAAKSELASYRRKAFRMATTCSDKAARAKINISISNESVRKVLHEMMEFAKTVWSTTIRHTGPQTRPPLVSSPTGVFFLHIMTMKGLRTMFGEEYENYMLHPAQFEGGIDIKMADTLFRAIGVIDNGMFPKETEMLTKRLVALFDDAPEPKPGIQKLGSLAYFSAGVISDQRENDYNDIPAPPFVPVSGSLDEKKDRINMLKREFPVMPGNLMQRQLAYAMGGKPTIKVHHATGKALPKIQKLVEKAEQLIRENPDMDVSPMLGVLLQKIDTETDRTFSGSMSDCYDYEWPGRYGKITYRIKYADGNAVRETADAMLEGALTEERIRALTERLNAYAHTAAFVPFESMTKTMAYSIQNALIDIRNGRHSSYGHGYIDSIQQAMVFMSRSLYDAIQAYGMYDSIADDGVRQFLIASGLLAKGGWKPDPDLWLRAARTVPACFDRRDIGKFSYTNDLQLTPEIHRGAVKIAEKYADEVLERLSDSINAGTVRTKIRKILGDRGENRG